MLDVGFDAVTALDFQGFELVVRDVQWTSRGYVYWLPKYANVGTQLPLHRRIIDQDCLSVKANELPMPFSKKSTYFAEHT